MTESTVGNKLWEQSISTICGFVAGAVQAVIGQPFDTIKVRVATAQGGKSGPGQALAQLWKNEGALALFKGLASPFFGNGLVVAFQFSGREFAQNQISDYYKISKDGLALWQIGVCGSFSGFVGGIVASPIEHIRIKMQIQSGPRETWLYKNTLHCFKSVLRDNGIRGLYHGFGITLLREQFYIIYFAVYHLLKSGSEKLTPAEKNMKLIMAGGIAGVAFWTLGYPFDCIKSKIQADSLANPYYRNSLHAARETYAQQGLRGFFKGYLPCLLRSFPVNAGSFFVYEGLYEALKGGAGTQ